jgi:PAS domain S-box-containing protein
LLAPLADPSFVRPFSAEPMAAPSPRILLVDEPGDDLALAALVLKGALKQAEIVPVESLSALSGALAAGAPAAVITERALGWSDGFAVLDAVRAAHPDCPVLFFSDRHEPSAEDTLRGLDGWLPKTSTGYLNLQTWLQRLLRRRAVPSPSVLQGAGVAQLPVAVITASRKGEILGANEAAARLLGVVDRGHLEGRALARILIPGPARDQLMTALESGEPIRGIEVELAREDPVRIWARLSLWSGAGPDGAARFACTLEDISPFKLEEQRLSHLAEELSRSNQALERFASVVSHDLRGPLGVVSRGARLLDEHYAEGLDDDAAELLQAVLQGSDRLEGMVQDILDLARLGARARPPEPTSLEAVADEALASLQPVIEECGASISRDALPTLEVDRGQITRVLENLLNNALKFRRDKPPLIHIGAMQEPGQWVFSVQDNGIGFAPQEAERVFGMFQRLHNGSHPGNGMGLAICKDIVERHGGRIWVQSMPGEGSAFYFSLPAGGPDDITRC